MAMKKGPWLWTGYFLGMNTTQLYRDYFITHCKDSYEPTSIMESKRFFLVFNVGNTSSNAFYFSIAIFYQSVIQNHSQYRIE